MTHTILAFTFASLFLASNLAQAAQNESEKNGASTSQSHSQIAVESQSDAGGTSALTDLHTKTEHKSSRPAFYEDLDKIDDVNPYVIKSVIVDGNKLIPRSQIKAVIKTKAGDFYHRKDIEADLKAIYGLGYFDASTFHVEAEKTAAGLVIRVHVKENPLLKKIAVSGNQIMPGEKIEELFKEQLQKPRSKTQIATALRTINDTYKNQGYLLAHATTGKDEPEGTMPVIVDEGIVQDIKIVCPNDEQKQVVQDALTLQVGAPYNEKILTSDLKAAFKTGKVAELQRQVDKDKSGGYIVTISAVQTTTKTKTRGSASALLKGGKAKPALPVLNRLIKSPMYKDIK